LTLSVFVLIVFTIFSFATFKEVHFFVHKVARKMDFRLIVSGFFFCFNKLKEAMDMRDCIARLIKCGMPREIALCVCKTFARANDFIGMERYVESVEEETRYREWQEW